MRNLLLVVFLLCFGLGFASCEDEGMTDDVVMPMTPDPDPMSDPSDDDCELVSTIDYYGEALPVWLTDDGAVPVQGCGSDGGGAWRCLESTSSALSDWYSLDPRTGNRVYSASAPCSECEAFRGDAYTFGWVCESNNFPLDEFPSCNSYIERSRPEGCS